VGVKAKRDDDSSVGSKSLERRRGPKKVYIALPA
jgi:hypothetical protein